MLNTVVYLEITNIAVAAGTCPTALVFAASPPLYHLAEHSLRFDRIVRSSLEIMLDGSACRFVEQYELKGKQLENIVSI